MPIEQKHASRPLTAGEESDLCRRGLTAWVTAEGSAQHEGSPVAARMAVKTKVLGDGSRHFLHFVVVHAGAAVLAVYRVHLRDEKTFMLRRMSRAPKDLVRLGKLR